MPANLLDIFVLLLFSLLALKGDCGGFYVWIAYLYMNDQINVYAA